MLNAVAIRDSYPFLRMNEFIDSLRDAKVSSRRDANSGYWRIEVDDRDQDKTAITSHYGPYKFIGVPLWLENATVALLGAMAVILASARWQLPLVYLDDIVVFSMLWEDYIEQVWRIFVTSLQSSSYHQNKKMYFLLRLLITWVTLSNLVAGNSSSIRSTWW